MQLLVLLLLSAVINILSSGINVPGMTCIRIQKFLLLGYIWDSCHEGTLRNP